MVLGSEMKPDVKAPLLIDSMINDRDPGIPAMTLGGIMTKALGQAPFTATLGEPGERNAQGFGSSSSGVALTRPISVTDAAGQVLYAKQTTDNQKAADSHLRLAGFRRAGEWVNGVASLEQIPRSSKYKRFAISAGVLVVLVALISVWVSRSFAAAPEAAQKACHERVAEFMQPGAPLNFKSTDLLKNSGVFASGGELYVVSGDLQGTDTSGSVHDMTYRCETYVDSSGGVHKVTAGTTWK